MFNLVIIVSIVSERSLLGAEWVLGAGCQSTVTLGPVITVAITNTNHEHLNYTLLMRSATRMAPLSAMKVRCRSRSTTLCGGPQEAFCFMSYSFTKSTSNLLVFATSDSNLQSIPMAYVINYSYLQYKIIENIRRIRKENIPHYYNNIYEYIICLFYIFQLIILQMK